MKEDYIKFEEAYLSEYAVKSSATKGRSVFVEPCPLRTEFQRDRDRIIHCKSFRRLKHKTQVFLSPHGDHYRTRLTHTLEVTQIARTMARALRLNEDLTEAIALGHDLGHTPFGHMGERELDALSGHFQHNEQSLRVVEQLEDDGKGLNLTFEVKDGILNHKSSGHSQTLEGYVVSFADRIAYINHDIDDAVSAGMLREQDLPKEEIAVLGNRKSQRIDSLVNDIIKTSYQKPFVKQSDEFREAMASLRKFMFDKVYFNPEILREEEKAKRLISYLYHYFTENPEEVPQQFKLHGDPPKIFIIDYIASMTDRFAVNLVHSVIVPDAWDK